MKKVLILFAHPKFEKSRANRALIEQVKEVEGVHFHDLYEAYPDFHIDVEYEKALLLEHDVIIWHHPFYWYSCPPLLKQWIDMVLEFNWAYGPEGNALAGKICLNAITTGGSREVYCSTGYNTYSVNEFLKPFEQTARLCKMTYFPPFATMGTYRLSDEEIEEHAILYKRLVHNLQQGLNAEQVQGTSFLNELKLLKAIKA
tara:strand:- start:1399 stop:2001 length:603 start_codon:yes stop_codon:yes gene_type:complete